MENNKNKYYTCYANIEFINNYEFKFVVPKCLVEDMELKNYVLNEIKEWVEKQSPSPDFMYPPLMGAIGGISVESTSTDEEMETLKYFGE